MPDLGAPEAGLRRDRRPWPARGEVDGLALAPSAPTLRGGGGGKGHAVTAGAAACSLARGGWVLAYGGHGRHSLNPRYAPERTGPCFPDRAARHVDKYGVPAANPSCPTDIRFYTTGY